jgi:hypothetical protein
MEKQSMRDSFIEDVKSELKKEADAIDGDFIDRRIDGLYALDGLNPPKLNDEALDAAARTIRARAAWRRRNTLAQKTRKSRFTRWAACGAVAACCLSFFANYLTAVVTGSCLLSKAGIKICRETTFCPCDIGKVEETGHSK